jgi:hypothetical protein
VLRGVVARGGRGSGPVVVGGADLVLEDFGAIFLVEGDVRGRTSKGGLEAAWLGIGRMLATTRDHPLPV